MSNPIDQNPGNPDFGGLSSALDLQRIPGLKRCPGGYRGACPACREDGGDRKGEHLFINEDGRYGCAAFKGDGEHRRRIFCLVGIKSAFPYSFPVKRRRKSKPIEKRQAEALAWQRELKQKAERRLASILDKHWIEDWRADLRGRSPVNLKSDPRGHWAAMIRALFPNDAILFIGRIGDSGSGRGEGHFRTVEEWLRSPAQPGPRIAAASFVPGSVSRSKVAVHSRPYLVLESDELIGHKAMTEREREDNMAASSALFRWCVAELHMTLAAVVETGHRSLHGWFVMPRDPRFFDQLRAIATSLRLDPSLFDQPQAPVRLPGCIHEKTGLPARLHYLANMI